MVPLFLIPLFMLSALVIVLAISFEDAPTAIANIDTLDRASNQEWPKAA